jgi:hypothetical protein
MMAGEVGAPGGTTVEVDTAGEVGATPESGFAAAMRGLAGSVNFGGAGFSVLVETLFVAGFTTVGAAAADVRAGVLVAAFVAALTGAAFGSASPVFAVTFAGAAFFAGAGVGAPAVGGAVGAAARLVAVRVLLVAVFAAPAAVVEPADFVVRVAFVGPEVVAFARGAVVAGAFLAAFFGTSAATVDLAAFAAPDFLTAATLRWAPAVAVL